MSRVIVAGVGMTVFAKPGRHPSYRVMAANAIRTAMEDAGVEADAIQQAYASYIYGTTGSGQHAIYDVLQTGIPIFNVNNACASGSSALMLGRQAIQSGAADCVLVVGFEEMSPGALEVDSTVEYAGDRIDSVLDSQGYDRGTGMTPRWFGAAGQQYLDEYGVSADLFAEVAVKSRRHAANNPYAVYQQPITTEEVLASKRIWGSYLTKLMACPPTCGAAAVVMVSQSYARKLGITRGVEILAQALATDKPDSWSDALGAAGAHNTARAAMQAYEQAGIGPDEVDVVELHDCFTPNEVISYEGLQLCTPGGASEFVARGDNTYGGKFVVNPSGGLMSKGHPIGATGVAQCCELSWHLRGMAGERQVPNARIALQHNIGLVGAAAVTIYRKFG